MEEIKGGNKNVLMEVHFMETNSFDRLSGYLLNSIPVACYLLDREGNFVYLNREAERFFQLKKKDILGLNVWKVFPESIATHCYISINAALSGNKTEAFEYISAVSNSWISMTAFPDENGGAIVMFSEIDEFRASKNQYQTLVENTPDIISRWNADLQLMFANKVYIEKTGRPLEKILGKTQIQIGQSPEVSLPWMEKMKDVFDTGKAQEYYHSYPGPYGELFYFSKMVPEFDLQGKVQSVLSIDRDITALKKAEQELESQSHFIQSIMDTLPDVVSVVRLPSRKLEYINKDPLVLVGYTKEEIMSMPSEEGTDHLVHADDLQSLLDYYERVTLLKDGETDQVEYRAKHKNGSYIWLSLRGAIFRRNEKGIPTYAFHIWQDITQTKNAELELKESKDLLQSIFDATPNSISVFNIVYNKQAEVEDFEILMFNKFTLKTVGLSINDVVGKLYSKLFPNTLTTGVFDEFKKVALSGRSAEFEIWYEGEGMHHWFRFKAAKLNNLLVVITDDITEHKQNELKSKNSLDMLQSVFDSTLIGMSVLEAVRDERGVITDFVIKMVSKELERETNRKDLVGKLYFQEYPGVRSVGIFDLMLQVMETGEPAGKEYAYTFDGFNKWFFCKFVKMGDGIVATNMDISERKNAETNAALINSIADSAPDMVYAIDLVNRKQIYSNYKIAALLNKSQQEIRHLDISFYDEFIHPEDRNNFYNNLTELRSAESKQVSALTYRLIDANGYVHWIRTRRSIYKYDESGQPSHIVGVSEDITEQRELQEKNHQLWLEHNEAKKQQRQEIFRASLKVQEQERKRISETLHNGIGQILYGIKLTLDRLKLNLPDVGKEQQKIWNEAQELLTKCIQESRRVSHELMPPALEDFGLKAALEDVCWQLRGEVSFNCHFTGDPLALDKYIQLSVYRIVQELMVNIIKHSYATQAVVRIVIENKITRIQVEDNGNGFTWAEVKNKGIGLSTIKAKVRLLNGKTEIKSDGSGTRIHIVLPIDLTVS
nr:PAS domain S-box protein [Pedobacter panaciterrae]